MPAKSGTAKLERGETPAGAGGLGNVLLLQAGFRSRSARASVHGLADWLATNPCPATQGWTDTAALLVSFCNASGNASVHGLADWLATNPCPATQGRRYPRKFRVMTPKRPKRPPGRSGPRTRRPAAKPRSAVSENKLPTKNRRGEPNRLSHSRPWPVSRPISATVAKTYPITVTVSRIIFLATYLRKVSAIRR